MSRRTLAVFQVDILVNRLVTLLMVWYGRLLDCWEIHNVHTRENSISMILFQVYDLSYMLVDWRGISHWKNLSRRDRLLCWLSLDLCSFLWRGVGSVLVLLNIRSLEVNSGVWPLLLREVSFGFYNCVWRYFGSLGLLLRGGDNLIRLPAFIENLVFWVSSLWFSWGAVSHVLLVVFLRRGLVTESLTRVVGCHLHGIMRQRRWAF